MKARIAVALLGMFVSLATTGCTSPAPQAEPPETTASEPQSSKANQELKLEDLLVATLEGVDDREVVVSRVTIPPNTSLPRHWHPGEEFAYVLEGSVVLWQEGEDDTIAGEGDVLKVPLKRVHTAITKDEGATILVFRVHELGRPGRTLVE